MKLKIVRNMDLDLDVPRLEEVWPKFVYKNDVFKVDKIEQLDDKHVNLVLDSGDVLLYVPSDSYQFIE
jgi:hypothetical protein